MIQQPPDHIIFLKQILENAARCRDVSRTVLLSTPRVNTVEVANHISRQTGQIVITEDSILKCFNKVLSFQLKKALIVLFFALAKSIKKRLNTSTSG